MGQPVAEWERPETAVYLAPAADLAALRRTAVVLVEVLAGARPVRAAVTVVGERVLARLVRAVRPSRGTVPVLRSWRFQQIGPGVVEGACVVAVGLRHHAVALRFEAAGAAWRCTELQSTLWRAR